MVDNEVINIRIGIMLLVLSVLIVSMNVILKYSIDISDSYSEKVGLAVNTVVYDTLMQLNSVDRVGAPTAYKIIDSCISAIDDLIINYANGTSTSDYHTLLKYAEKNVRVTVISSGTGFYRVQVVEV